MIQRSTNTQSTSTASYPLTIKTQDVNDTLGYFALLAITASGKWQWDDTNQTDYPILRSDLVLNQQDIVFLVDGATPANSILDLKQVRIKDNNGVWKTLPMIDRLDPDFNINQYEGVTGVPEKYDLTADGILLFPTPNYNSTAGIEIYVARTPSYFLTTDTTKSAGIPIIFHPYLYLKPSYMYCMIKNLPQTKGLAIEVANMERMISDYYSRRVRTEKPRLKAGYQNNR